jgi:hypothetical protein
VTTGRDEPRGHHMPPNVNQLELFAAHGDGIDAAFWKFHTENPHVYSELVRLAKVARSRGFRRIGIKHLFEVARWEIAMRTHDATGLKLNNNLTSRYARLVMDQEPELVGFFETRELKTESALDD